MNSNLTDARWGFFFGTLFALIFVFLFVFCSIVWPIYNVWASEKHGQAELAQATFNRQIKIQEAHATEESAKSLADAEVIRAEGVAKANQIIGTSLKDNEAYLRYLWIHSLQDTHDQIIYIPTEGGMPVLEAGRRK